MRRLAMLTAMLLLPAFATRAEETKAEPAKAEPAKTAATAATEPAKTDAAKAEAVGTVVALKGTVTATGADGATRTLKLNDPIYREDTVKTAGNGRVQMMFLDNSIASLGRESDMKIKEYEFKPADNQAKMVTKVESGTFRVMSGKITQIAPENFKTETATATIGIRGSFYGGRIGPAGLQVAFLGGKGITVGNAHGTVVITRPLFGTTVAPGASPKQPRQFSASELAGMNPGAGGGNGGGDNNGNGGNNGGTTGDSGDDDDSGDTTADAGGDDDDDDGGDLDGGFDTADNGDTGGTGGGDTGDTGDTYTASTNDIGSEAADSVDSEVQSGLQSDSSDTVGENSGATLQVVSGHYLGVRMDTGMWFGPTNGTKYLGNYSGNAVDQDGWSISFDFSGLSVSYESEYYCVTTLKDLPGRTVYLSSDTISNDYTEVHYDNRGEFVMWQSFCAGSNDDEFYELGFVGLPTLSMPTSGIAHYSGIQLLGVKDTDADGGAGIIEDDYGDLDVAVNFSNKVAIGFFDCNDNDEGSYANNGFFYGTLNGNELTNVRVITLGWQDDTANSELVSLTGGSTYTKFYGSSAQGFGITANGNVLATSSGSNYGKFEFIGGGYSVDDADLAAVKQKTGTATATGFVAGLADASGSNNSSIFWSSNIGDLSLTLNRDAGTVSGTLNAIDASDAQFCFSNIEVGGSSGSAYVADNCFIAELGGSNNVNGGASTGSLKPNCSVLWTEKPSAKWGDYIEWGYWATAFDRPDTGVLYYVESGAGVWVAGTDSTSTSVISNLMSTNFVGYYKGGAACVSQASGSDIVNQYTGSSYVVINFGSATINNVTVGSGTYSISGNSWQGSLDFTSFKADLSGNYTVNTNGFSGNVTNIAGSTPMSSGVNGTYYGPAAENIAGNFQAVTSGGTKYTGVFGGAR